jgi:hypothetical protein
MRHPKSFRELERRSKEMSGTPLVETPAMAHFHDETG